jgi:carbon-monoxide dehydrogenase medium subunit
MALQNYFSPKTVEEAISLLSQHGDKARVISGGTDFLAQMKRQEPLPDYLISLGGIHDLNYIRYDEATGLRVGALTPIGDIAGSSLVCRQFSILAQAAGMLGTPAIRNQATLGGNLCNAAPSADTAPPLLVLGAKAKIAGAGGEEIIPIENFFVGPGLTILEKSRMLIEIQISDLHPHSGAAYLKQKRREGADIAVVGVAALVVLEEEILKDVRIALGAVAPTPVRAKKAEGILKGKKLGPQLLEETGRAACHESTPIDDIRGSADYRRKLVAALTKRAVTQAVFSSKGSDF